MWWHVTLYHVTLYHATLYHVTLYHVTFVTTCDCCVCVCHCLAQQCNGQCQTESHHGMIDKQINTSIARNLDRNVRWVSTLPQVTTSALDWRVTFQAATQPIDQQPRSLAFEFCGPQNAAQSRPLTTRLMAIRLNSKNATQTIRHDSTLEERSQPQGSFWETLGMTRCLSWQ